MTTISKIMRNLRLNHDRIDFENSRQILIKNILIYIYYGICNPIFHIHTANSMAIYIRTSR